MQSHRFFENSGRFTGSNEPAATASGVSRNSVLKNCLMTVILLMVILFPATASQDLQYIANQDCLRGV